ncbi:hypothetical protein [Paraburkholderia fungorum]|uniref:hypothetical protein n=1 Tax=Paraburkholderia fungorum TaxID=134537 RepID=UPI001C1EF232|nr:hypothetical protein [Paraburkholderia fungorum]MBU7440917.1 hypothetical protein [Paraburkholderia fungorum]
MKSPPNLDSESLDVTLEHLRERIATSEKAYPRRASSVDELSLWFATPEAACSPCGEKVTSMSTCTKIDTQTNPTVVGEPKEEEIREDLAMISQELATLGNT